MKKKLIIAGGFVVIIFLLCVAFNAHYYNGLDNIYENEYLPVVETMLDARRSEIDGYINRLTSLRDRARGLSCPFWASDSAQDELVAGLTATISMCRAFATGNGELMVDELLEAGEHMTAFREIRGYPVNED